MPPQRALASRSRHQLIALVLQQQAALEQVQALLAAREQQVADLQQRLAQAEQRLQEREGGGGPPTPKAMLA